MMSFAQSGSKTEANGVFGALVRFILLTSARRGEAAELRWTELQGRDWTLPAARNKAKVVYDRHEEKQRAYEALASQIDRIVRPRANLVGIKR